MEAPVRPHGFNDHHLGKVLARKQADEDPLGIGDSQRRCLRSVEPVKHGLKSRMEEAYKAELAELPPKVPRAA